MQELKPTKTSKSRTQKIFVNSDLNECSHVWIDSVKKALEPPYEGPYLVIKRYVF